MKKVLKLLGQLSVCEHNSQKSFTTEGEFLVVHIGVSDRLAVFEVVKLL